MESSSPTDRHAPRPEEHRDTWSPLGDVASAFVRRMNESELTPAAVADVVAEDLSDLLGGAVAVILRDQRTGTESAAVSQNADHEATALRRTVDHHGEDGSTPPRDFVDVVLETGQSFVAPDGPGSSTDDTAGTTGTTDAAGTTGTTDAARPATDQQLLAVPVVANDGTLGVIAATRDDGEPFSGDDLDLMTRVADVTALAVRGMSSPPAPVTSDATEDVAVAEASHALESAADAIFLIDRSGHLLSSNLATQRLLGFSDRELVGLAVRDIVADGSATRRSSDLPDFESPPPGSFNALYEVELQRDDGTVVAVELSFGKVVGTDRDLYVAVGRDVSQRKRTEDRLRREASVDSLTGLLNRASAHRALGRSMHRGDAGCEVAVLFIDLDGFKHVNDTSGHQAGDEVLRAVADRLTESVRHDDLVARYGGDEFLVVLEADKDIDAEVHAVCERIEAAFTEPFAVGADEHSLGASVGMAIQGRHGTTLSQLLAHADADMYRHKERRRSP
jgi:diguanylate cyclase (GGDEF)-like protein/PAS domain S-box-containing protein